MICFDFSYSDAFLAIAYIICYLEMLSLREWSFFILEQFPKLLARLKALWLDNVLDSSMPRFCKMGVGWFQGLLA